MDVHCTTCGELWDTYHLWHDAVFEALPLEEAEAWHSLPHEQKQSDRHREQFRQAGWEFGRAIINVIRCPCCPNDAKPNPDRLYIKAKLEQMLGDDEDGLASTFEDYRL